MKDVLVHFISDKILMNELSGSTKLTPLPGLMVRSKAAGQVAAETFLANHRGNIGSRSNVDLKRFAFALNRMGFPFVHFSDSLLAGGEGWANLTQGIFANGYVVTLLPGIHDGQRCRVFVVSASTGLCCTNRLIAGRLLFPDRLIPRPL